MSILEGEKIADREGMKREALKRMQSLNLDQETIRKFEVDDIVTCSDAGNIVDVPEDIKVKMQQWEEQYGCMPYHVLHTFIYGFEAYEYMYVSIYPEDWDYEYSLIKECCSIVRSENLTIPEYSESGSIRFVNVNGTLKRIG